MPRASRELFSTIGRGSGERRPSNRIRRNWEVSFLLGIEALARRHGPKRVLSRALFIVLPVLLLSGACSRERLSGSLWNGSPDNSVQIPDEPSNPSTMMCITEGTPPPPQLRRLSYDQYRNTLRDLFGGSLGTEIASLTTYPATVISHGFATDASANNVNESESNQIEDNAADLAALIANRVTEVMPCVRNPQDASEFDGCIDGFINEFGQRAYRRPLRDSERTLVRGIYDIGREQTPVLGLTSVLEFFLQSPALLYQIEQGAEPVADAPGKFYLDDYELATRLSYFLWNSTPDAPLMAAAATGELRKLEGMERQARRLVQDARVFDSLETFHRDLTHSYRLEEVGQNDPSFTPAMREAMRREGRRFLEAVDARNELHFLGLFGANRYPVAEELADIYGVEVPSGAPTEVIIPNRRGLLGLPSVMASIGADVGKNSTIVRAIYVLESILCQTLPSFPGDIDVTTPLDGSRNGATARDRLAPTTTNATCRGCHDGINPSGFALEQYDALGRYRTEENGTTINASGELYFPGATGQFSNSVEFLDLIASSPTARTCYVDHWLQAALGRSTAEADECTVKALALKWSDNSADLRELLVQIALTDDFRQREIKEEEE
jgi:hypothetical protein